MAPVYPPQAAPKLRILRFQPPGIFAYREATGHWYPDLRLEPSTSRSSMDLRITLVGSVSGQARLRQPGGPQQAWRRGVRLCECRALRGAAPHQPCSRHDAVGEGERCGQVRAWQKGRGQGGGVGSHSLARGGGWRGRACAGQSRRLPAGVCLCAQGGSRHEEPPGLFSSFALPPREPPTLAALPRR